MLYTPSYQKLEKQYPDICYECQSNENIRDRKPCSVCNPGYLIFLTCST